MTRSYLEKPLRTEAEARAAMAENETQEGMTPEEQVIWRAGFDVGATLEREACAQVAECIEEDAGTAIAAGIRLRSE